MRFGGDGAAEASTDGVVVAVLCLRPPEPLFVGAFAFFVGAFAFFVGAFAFFVVFFFELALAFLTGAVGVLLWFFPEVACFRLLRRTEVFSSGSLSLFA